MVLQLRHCSYFKVALPNLDTSRTFLGPCVFFPQIFVLKVRQYIHQLSCFLSDFTLTDVSADIASLSLSKKIKKCLEMWKNNGSVASNISTAATVPSPCTSFIEFFYNSVILFLFWHSLGWSSMWSSSVLKQLEVRRYVYMTVKKTNSVPSWDCDGWLSVLKTLVARLFLWFPQLVST